MKKIYFCKFIKNISKNGDQIVCEILLSLTNTISTFHGLMNDLNEKVRKKAVQGVAGILEMCDNLQLYEVSIKGTFDILIAKLETENDYVLNAVLKAIIIAIEKWQSSESCYILEIKLDTKKILSNVVRLNSSLNSSIQDLSLKIQRELNNNSNWELEDYE